MPLSVFRCLIAAAAIAGLLWVPACKKKAPPKQPVAAPAPTRGSAAVAKRTPARVTAQPPSMAPAAPDEVSPACAAYDKKIADSSEPYLKAFSNLALELSPDGRSFLFLSNRGGGSMQLHLGEVGRPGATPRTIALAKDRVGAARFTPDGRYILFNRDRDNNENWQILRANADGSGVVPLTSDLGMFHYLPEVSPDGKTLYYFRGEHKKGEFELVAQSIRGGAVRSIFKGKGFHDLTDLNPGGTEGLVTIYLSPSQTRLLAVDLKSGKSRRLGPTAGAKAHAKDGVYSADGKSVYYITDEGVARAELRRIDARTGAVRARFADPTAEVAQVQAARRGGVVAVQLDFGSHKGLRLLNAKSLESTVSVKLPLASAGMGRFSADGRWLPVTISRPDQPTESFGVDARTGRMKPLRADVRPGLAKLAKVRVKVVRIPTFDALKVPANLYLPVNRGGGKRLPVLVVVHGGPAASSSVGWNPFNAFFISRGFAVVEPNVRGSTGFGKAYEKADNGRKRMDAVKDLEYVNRWLRKQPWADPDKLVVFGGSYGGYMTYMAMGHQADLWRVGMGLVGVVNLKTFLETTEGAIRLAFREEFGDLKKDGPFLDRISPYRVLHRFKKPLFVYQGATDPRVPRSEQDMLVRALRKRGVTVEYMVAPDEGHSLSHKHTKLELLGRGMRFLDVHLGRPRVPRACKSRKPRGA